MSMNVFFMGSDVGRILWTLLPGLFSFSLVAGALWTWPIDVWWYVLRYTVSDTPDWGRLPLLHFVRLLQFSFRPIGDNLGLFPANEKRAGVIPTNQETSLLVTFLGSQPDVLHAHKPMIRMLGNG